MGRLMNIFGACLGLGIAAGTGYYLYRKSASGKSEEENTENSVAQSDAVKEDNSTNERDRTGTPPSARARAQKAKKQRTGQMRHRSCQLARKTTMRNRTKIMFRQQARKRITRRNQVSEDAKKVSYSGTVHKFTEFVLASTTSLMDYTLACFRGGTKKRRFHASFSFEFKFALEEVEELSMESVESPASTSRASLAGCAMQD